MDMAKPKIRFKGYTDDWEQRKFGDLVEKYEDPIDTPTDGYMRLGIRSHAKGTFHSYVEKGKELETAKMFRVAANNFIVNITFGWEHAVAITDESDAGKLVSHRFPQYSFENGMIPVFFKYLILDENFKHHLELSSPGGAGRNRVLKLNDMLEYKMKFPCEDEQRKLASYFDDLDHLITLHQRKCEETKKLKKYMLQKMFPQNGQTVPEIRFSGFTDAWEQRKLGETCKLNGRIGFRGYTEKDIVTKEAGGVLTFSPTNIVNNKLTMECKNTYITYEKYDESPEIKISNGDILFVKTGSTLGKSALVTGLEVDASINPQIVVIRVEKESETFMSNVLITHGIMKQVAAVKIGGAVPTMTETELKNLTYFAPAEKEEQKKIGDYFTNLDHLITLHQHKCEQLQSMKKFMLQNMFV